MSLFGLFERRGIENPAVPITAATVLDYLGGGMSSDSGIQVTEHGSLKMSAVYRAVSLISGLGGALPLHTYAKGTREQRSSLLLDNPHPDLTPYEFWRLSYVHRCLWGNFYAQKVRNGAGQITWLYPIHPSKVRVGVATERTAANPSGKVFEVTTDTGNSFPLTPNEIFHIPGLGYDGAIGLSPIRLAAQGIGMALAAEKYAAKLFGSGNLLSGILKTTQRIQQGDANRLQQRWQQMRSGLENAHSVAILDSGAEFQSLTMPNDDAQLMDSRDFQVTEIARYFGVPPFLLMQTAKSTSWGTGLSQQALGFMKFDLHPTWLAPTEQRVTRELLPSNRYAKYKVEGLLRGDSTERAQFYNTMRNIGVFSVNEIRDLEELAPVEDGDGRIEPLNMKPLGAPDPNESDEIGAGESVDQPAIGSSNAE